MASEKVSTIGVITGTLRASCRGVQASTMGSSRSKSARRVRTRLLRAGTVSVRWPPPFVARRAAGSVRSTRSVPAPNVVASAFVARGAAAVFKATMTSCPAYCRE